MKGVMYCAGMDNSNESTAHMLGLNVVDDQECHNITFEDGSTLGTKRLHFDSESSIDTDVNINGMGGFMIGKRIKLENTSEDEGTSGLIQGASCDELGDESGIMLGAAPAESMNSSTTDMAFATEDNVVEEEACILIHHMDIKEPLTNLKKAMEDAHRISLDGYEFYLQDTTLLAGHKNLVQQCVQGCGTVQVNLQLKIESDGTKKINILDVMKPSDSYLLATGNPAFSPNMSEETTPVPPAEADSTTAPDKNLIRWVMDVNFKVNQQKLFIPQDPMEWEMPHVRHWLLWAVRQFNLTGIKLADWRITGATLCNLSLDDFKSRVPYDPSDTFWTHLELLKRCKFVAVMQNPEDLVQQEEADTKPKESELDKNIMRSKDKKYKASMKSLLPQSDSSLIQPVTWGNRTGNNGQVQLWQFLLDLLTDKEHRECIQWLGAEGEFKLIEPEKVAHLWGKRKNKPSMNYEKLSRALRYYYDGDMIAKVHGKRFVYKFVCDLKQLLGYSAFELNRLVIEAEMRAMNSACDPLQNHIFGHRDLV